MESKRADHYPNRATIRHLSKISSHSSLSGLNLIPIHQYYHSPILFHTETIQGFSYLTFFYFYNYCSEHGVCGTEELQRYNPLR